MLEMPALACALAAIYHFHRYLDQRRRRDLFLAALASALCALTRFDAVYLLPLFLIMMGFSGELRLLWRKDVLLAAALALVLIPTESVPPRLAATAIGLATLVGEVFGGALAPALAGQVADRFGLAAPLWMAAGGALTVLIASLFLTETAPTVVAGRKAK